MLGQRKQSLAKVIIEERKKFCYQYVTYTKERERDDSEGEREGARDSDGRLLPHPPRLPTLSPSRGRPSPATRLSNRQLVSIYHSLASVLGSLDVMSIFSSTLRHPQPLTTFMDRLDLLPRRFNSTQPAVGNRYARNAF